MKRQRKYLNFRIPEPRKRPKARNQSISILTEFHAIDITKPIDHRTSRQFVRQCRQAIHQGRRNIVVTITSSGGDLGQAKLMVRWLQLLNRHADQLFVAAIGECRSAAVRLFVALPRRQRITDENTLFMVHRTTFEGEDGRHLERRELGPGEFTTVQHTDGELTGLLVDATYIKRSAMKVIINGGFDYVFDGREAINLGVAGGFLTS